MVFSKSVKHRLIDQNLNSSKLARLTNLSPQYMHNLLNGKRRWNEDTMLKVCDALGLEMRVIPKEESEKE
ncbi:helix-turn-helix transcriptional regulator [Paenibacillus larvae]